MTSSLSYSQLNVNFIIELQARRANTGRGSGPPPPAAIAAAFVASYTG